MAQRSDGKAARARRIALATSAAAATLLVAGCERDAEHDAPAPRNPAHLTFQLAVSLTDLAPAPRVAKGATTAVPPRRSDPVALAIPDLLPMMPAPTMAPPIALVIDLPPPAAPATLPPPILLPGEKPPLLAAVSSPPAAAPAIAIAPVELAPAIIDAVPELAAAPRPFDDRAVYIPQISQSVRTAYIAQVDAAAPGQRLAVRAGDTVLGSVQFQVADGVVSVNIGQVLDLFEGRFDSARFAELRGSQAAQSFVSLDQLQGAGIPLEYNAAYDELTLRT